MYFCSFEQIFESIDVLRRDIEELKVNLAKFDPQIGFCHNDLAHTNLIYNEEEGERGRGRGERGERERERERARESGEGGKRQREIRRGGEREREGGEAREG